MTLRVVIAIGGNSLIKDKNRREIDDQLAAVRETAGYIADFIQVGYEVAITHGDFTHGIQLPMQHLQRSF